MMSTSVNQRKRKNASVSINTAIAITDIQPVINQPVNTFINTAATNQPATNQSVQINLYNNDLSSCKSSCKAKADPVSAADKITMSNFSSWYSSRMLPYRQYFEEVVKRDNKEEAKRDNQKVAKCDNQEVAKRDKLSLSVVHYPTAFPLHPPLWDETRFHQDRRLEMELDWLRKGMFRHSRFTYLEVWARKDSLVYDNYAELANIIEFEIVRFTGRCEFEARICKFNANAKLMNHHPVLGLDILANNTVLGGSYTFEFNLVSNAWILRGRENLFDLSPFPPYYYLGGIDWNEKYLDALLSLSYLQFSDLFDSSFCQSSSFPTQAPPTWEWVTCTPSTAFRFRSSGFSGSSSVDGSSGFSSVDGSSSVDGFKFYRWEHQDHNDGFFIANILPSHPRHSQFVELLNCPLPDMPLNTVRQQCMDYLQCRYNLRYFVDRLKSLDYVLPDCLHIVGILDLIASYLLKF